MKTPFKKQENMTTLEQPAAVVFTTRIALANGQLISKGLFGILEFLQKMNESFLKKNISNLSDLYLFRMMVIKKIFKLILLYQKNYEIMK